KIIDCLARVRRFKNVEVEYMDTFSTLYPIYNVVPSEKLVDSFLDQYLWYEAMDQQRLFPNWVKPSDMEPVPVLLYKWCQGINDSPGLWDVTRDESTVLLHANLEDSFYDNVDWNLFRPLLEMVMDKTLVEYIVSRHDVVVEFKDMSYQCRKGLLRGFMFSSFLSQYWGLVVDVLLLGTQRSQEIAGPARRPNPFMTFMRDPLLATSHPIRGYCRYKNEVYVLLKYTKIEADDVRRRYLDETKHDSRRRSLNASVYGFKN
ncbi:putative U5 snRNA-associated splicing factor, partial [Trypanosoma cruzi]